MNETFVTVPDGQMFVRHSSIETSPDRTAILLIHGLGDSGLCFLEAFSRPELRDFALIAPDLLGFGESSPASDGNYSFDAQIARLWAVCDYLGVHSLCLIGHSMGGDIATLMAAATDRNRTVRAIINAEGNLTSDDLFISSQAVEAARHDDFNRWFTDDFMEATVLRRWVPQWRACHRYYSSLSLCRPEAFLASAEEVCRRNTDVQAEEFSPTGSLFKALAVPKLYCWSDKSLSPRSRSILNRVPNVGFENSFHWMMIDSPDSFYPTVSAFLRDYACGGTVDT
ncbi:MAG TPA: alpha/beta fold hydrolase [Candidatus Binatia bacterium]